MDSVLTSLGLTNYEVKTYESLIKLGQSTATKISKNSGVPQGKIYLVLDSLMKKGLVDLVPKKPAEFTPNNPEVLVQEIKNKSKQLELIGQKIEQLKELYKQDSELNDSKIVVRQGKKAFYNVLETMAKPKDHEYSIKWSSEFDEQRAKDQKKLINRGVDIKVLSRCDDAETDKNLKKWMKLHKNIRILENDGVAMSILDEKEVMIMLLGCNATVLIRDKAFAKVMKRMFLETYNNAQTSKAMADKKRILLIVRESLDSFKDLEGIKFFGVLGSFLKGDAKSGDLDIISIGDKDSHEKLKIHLAEKLLKNGVRSYFFSSISEKHLCPKDHLLIHDLYYESPSDLIKKEWKAVINSMRECTQTLYGKDIRVLIPPQPVDRTTFYEGILLWINKIETEQDYLLLESYLLKLGPIFKNYNFYKDYKKITEVVDSGNSWRLKLTKFKKIIS